MVNDDFENSSWLLVAGYKRHLCIDFTSGSLELGAWSLELGAGNFELMANS